MNTASKREEKNTSHLTPNTSLTEAILVSNGPGELYTWVYPVLSELRRSHPELRTTISLIPCQFAAGSEARIAATFGADGVTTPADFLRFVGTGKRPDAYGGNGGFVLSLGGNTNMALQLGDKLGYDSYRYSFVPYWHNKLKRLFVHDDKAWRQARRLGAPEERLELIGNLVADAVQQAAPSHDKGTPHIYLNAGSRDEFAVHLIPFMIAVVDALAQEWPKARFVWPVSRLLQDETVAAGIAGLEKATLGGMAGRREGDIVLTPAGGRLELVSEAERYAQMRAADLALTIPGTNTLELGIAGVPGVVILPLNKAELIPLEGLGHWLSLIPLVGKPLKRHAVKLAAPHFPVSLPNNLSGEDLMVELKGDISLEQVLPPMRELLNDPQDLAERRARLLAIMPQPGAAAKLVERIMAERA